MFLFSYIESIDDEASEKIFVYDFKKKLNDYQLYAIYWMLKTKRLIEKNILANNMKIEKMNDFLIVDVDANWFNLT